MRTDCDVLIIGGGPAGSWTGRILAEHGWDVLLWDRARFPRDKPCGEYLSPGAVSLLQDGGAGGAVRALTPEPLVGARITAHGGRSFDGTFHAEDGFGWSLRRTHLDLALLTLARESGVRVEQGTAFRSFEREGDSVAVEGGRDGEPVRVRCRMLVGADGNHSAVARRMGGVRPIPRLRKVAFVTHARGIAGLTGRVEMHAGPDGCVGIGPGPDGEANVTVVIRPQTARATPDVPSFVRGAVERYPGLRGRFDSAAWDGDVLRVGTFGHTTRSAVADGVALVGDSAAFIDPFTGEGVYFALRGAQMAAECIGAALRRDDTSARALEPYERDRRAEFRAKYVLCDLVERIVGVPWALTWFAGRFRRHPELADDLIRTTGDLVPPSERVFTPAFWARLTVW